MRHIILDTDLAMGAGWDIDDGFALALAHADPDIAIDFVTTVNGNTDVESATMLTLELAQRLERPDLVVFQGAAAPITRPDRGRQARQDVRDSYGHHLPTPGFAAAEIAAHVMAHPGEITIVAIGPLTNIATAMALEPRLAANVAEIVIMGGVFLGQTGRSTMSGEFNVWVDPESAEAVLHSGAKIRWVGLDVTMQVRLTRQHAEQMRAGGRPFSVFAGDATLTWIDYLNREVPGDLSSADSCAMHDPLAVAVVTHPELVTWTPAHVGIVTGDGISRGVMVTDLLHAVDAPQPNCHIATAVDVEGFTNFFLDAVTNL